MEADHTEPVVDEHNAAGGAEDTPPNDTAETAGTGDDDEAILVGSLEDSYDENQLTITNKNQVS